MMNRKKIVLYIIIMLLVILFTNILSIKLTLLFTTSQEDKDYQKLNLKIEEYDIDYYTIYSKDISYEYKVYKINNLYKGDSIDKIKVQLENSNDWSRKKFYEYIMMKFYEIIDGKINQIDREDLYYYNKGLIYAIIDIKNAKLYYLKNNIIDYHNNYNEILEIKINNCTEMEIYSVKGQEVQNDGIDYYTYTFNKEKGKEIEKNLSKSKIWNIEKLDNEILDCFKYNSEIFNIQNGYYCYKKVYEINNSYKNVNKYQKAVGYEVGVYDCDKNALYYYWRCI